MKKGLVLNTSIVAIIALAAAVGSFLAYGSEKDAVLGQWELEGQIALEGDFIVQEAATLRRNGRDALTLMPGSQASLSWDEASSHLNVDLSAGSALFSALAGDFSVSVGSDFARVDSQGSAAYIALEEGQMQVYALQHPSLLTLTSLEGEDLNALSVPSGYRVRVPFSKVNATIAKLRLTKLSKEFPVFALEDTDLSAEVTAAFDAMQESYAEASARFLIQGQSQSDFGPPVLGVTGTLYTSLTSARELLTVMPHAEQSLDKMQQSDYLLYAMSNLLYGENSEGLVWTEKWAGGEHNKEDLEALYADLFFVLPGDELYPVKAASAEVLFERERFLESLRRKYQEIESLLGRGAQVDAEEAYETYQKEFEVALRSGVFDDQRELSALSREYMLLELLLRQNALFYKADSVSLLADLEMKILELAGDDQSLDEERQAFVQSKLRFLDNLFDFVAERKVSPQEAGDLANELVFSAEQYLNAVSSQVAVQSYFEDKLEEYELSIQFVNSPEFYSYSSFEEGLKAFSQKADELDELNAYLQQIRSGEADEDEVTPLAEATAEVEEALTRNAVRYSEVISLGDAANRLFEVRGARSSSTPFTANYDRETGLLYDIVIGEVRFSSGLLLEDIQEVVEQTVKAQQEAAQEDSEDEVDSNEGEQPVSESGASRAESVALDYAQSQFDDLGIPVDLILVDLDANLFTFEGEITEYALSVSGTYDSNTGRVSEVVWVMDGRSMNLPDVDLSQLEEAIRVTYEALRA